MHYNIWRAPTENDRNTKHVWRSGGYDRAVVKVYHASVDRKNGQALITAEFSVAAVFIQRILTGKAEFLISPGGEISACIDVKTNPGMPFLPRFGIRMFLPKYMDQVSYLGYGPYESYIDKHRASWYGRFNSAVKDMHEDYIFPEENGSHWGCTDLCVSGGGLKLSVQGDNFSFNTSRFTQEELTEKLHNFELRPSPYTVFCLDYRQSGIGSNNCGPELLEQYRLQGNFSFAFRLLPETS
jgi:beta-galactosidase